jgi:hypothetical protein
MSTKNPIHFSHTPTLFSTSTLSRSMTAQYMTVLMYWTRLVYRIVDRILGGYFEETCKWIFWQLPEDLQDMLKVLDKL